MWCKRSKELLPQICSNSPKHKPHDIYISIGQYNVESLAEESSRNSYVTKLPNHTYKSEILKAISNRQWTIHNLQ